MIRHTGQRTTRWDCRGAVDSTCADLVPRQVAEIFLFLTYYFQLTLAYSAVKSGLAFLPMVAAIVVASTTCSGGADAAGRTRPLVPAGLLIASSPPALAGRLGLPFLQPVTTSEGHVAEPGSCDEQLSGSSWSRPAPTAPCRK